jgi:hypothetical protein
MDMSYIYTRTTVTLKVSQYTIMYTFQEIQYNLSYTKSQYNNNNNNSNNNNKIPIK